MNNKDMAEFAENLWKNYIEPKMEASRTGDISYYRATVIANNGDGTLTIKPACDNERTANCTMEMSDVTAGSAVLVMRMGNGNAAENHLVFARTNAVNPILNMGGGFTPTGTISIVSNGTYDVTNYASADVSVPTGIFPSGTISITSNGTYNVSEYESANVDVNADGYTADEIATRRIRGMISGDALLVDTYAFNACGITEANFSRCLAISVAAFLQCRSLQTVSFPTCSLIWHDAFAFCTALIEANFPACLSVQSSAFYACSALATANFPMCTQVMMDTFFACYALAEVSFPGCKAIGNNAFAQCSALTTVSFPVNDFQSSLSGLVGFSSCR